MYFSGFQGESRQLSWCRVIRESFLDVVLQPATSRWAFQGYQGASLLEDFCLPYSYLLQASHLLILQKTRETRSRYIQDTAVQTAEVPHSKHSSSVSTGAPCLHCFMPISPPPTSQQSLPLPPPTQLPNFLSFHDQCDFVKSDLDFH